MKKAMLVPLVVLPLAIALGQAPAQPAQPATQPPAQQPGQPGAGQTPPGVRPGTVPGSVPGQRPGAPGQGGRKGDADLPALFKPVYEKPDVLAAANFPKCELKQPNTATYIGFQFGPTKKDVLYCCFDADDPKDIHERCWWFIVGTNATPVAKLENSKTMQIHLARGAKMPKDKPREFELPVLRAKFGDVEVAQKLTLVYGLEQKHLLHVTAEVQFKDAQGRSECTLQGLMAEEILPVPNEIKILPLIEMPVIENYVYTKANPPWVRPYLRAGKEFIMMPGKGMDDSFEVVVTQKPDVGALVKPEPARPGAAAHAEADRIVAKEKLPIKLRENSRPGESGDGTPIQLKMLKGGHAYDVNTRIDLGPFGTLKGSAAVTIPGKIKT